MQQKYAPGTFLPAEGDIPPPLLPLVSAVVEDLAADSGPSLVTPGMQGRLAGGLLARGDWRICMRNALSYTIRVPPGVVPNMVPPGVVP